MSDEGVRAAAVRERDLDNRAAKDRGEVCFRYGCQEPEPRFGVLWKCPVGHRLEILYCDGCGPRMLAMAVERAGKASPLCAGCAGVALMVPVTEGMDG